MTLDAIRAYYRTPTGEMLYDEWIMLSISRGAGPTEAFRTLPMHIPASYTGFLRRWEVLRDRYRRIP